MHETFWWLALIGINPLEFPGRSAVVTSTSWGLLASNVLLIVIFAACVWIGRKSARVDMATGQLFARFALSILPIALGYHIAHYLTSFLVSGQYLMIVASDPMATGANLLGTSDWRVTTGFLADPDLVRVIYLTQAGVVVVSHVIGVLMAHRIASDFCQSRMQTLLLQWAIAVFMVFYTLFGLWLLASPRGV